jgi:hypothetical protein
MPASIRRATVSRFDSSTWTAVVCLDGALSESILPVAQWLPSNLVVLDAEVAVLLFDDTNPDDGLIVGPYGGVLSTVTLPALNVGTASGAGAGVVNASGAGSFSALNLNTSGAATGEARLSGAIRASTALGARIYNNGAVSHATSGAWQQVTFNSESFDTDGCHSTVSNTSRLTCQTAGIYLVIGTVQWAASAVGIRVLRLLLNGATAVGYDQPGAIPVVQTVTGLYSLAAGDYVELSAYQNSGGALNMDANGVIAPSLMMVRIA